MAVAVLPYTENPAGRVRDVFEHIRTTRMADVPILNPQMQVDVIGWRKWAGEWLGILITPWTINLMILPGGGGEFRPLVMDERQSWQFPSGFYDFMGGEEAALGPYQICSLFSPVMEFESHAAAVETAQAVFEALMKEENAEADAASRLERARAEGQSISERPMSRRGFLRGGR